MSVAAPAAPIRKILLATDLSSRCDRAWERAVALSRAWGASLHVVHAVQAVPPALPAGVDARDYARTHPDPRESVLRALERLRGDTPARVHVHDGVPARVILDVAHGEGCDLIVLGESHDSLVALESTLEQVVRKAAVSTLLVRARVSGAHRRVVVGTDFTDEARQALVTALQLFPEAAVTYAHAAWLPYAGLLAGTPAAEDDVARKHERLRAELAQLGLPAEVQRSVRTRVEAGPPAVVLRRVAEEDDADLVVIGAHERGLVFDSVVGASRAIVHGIPGDLLVVRARREASAP